jgi:ABC-2 type transport system ATP-binding protein
MIKAINLTKQFPKTLAVNNLNLEVENELFVFLGPNGAGKTTTIKMMTGLLAPTKGSVFINAINLQKEPLAAKRQFGLVLERPYLYEKLTPREYVVFLARVYNVPQAQADSRMQQLFEIFEMRERMNDLIEDLSQGMKQKTAIVGALIHNPPVLFLDEPTVGLDPPSAKNFKDLLKGLVKKGTTVFMSTHILELAEPMCDRIGIINNGQLQAVGTLDELYKTSSKKATNLEQLFLEIIGSDGGAMIDRFLEGA